MKTKKRQELLKQRKQHVHRPWDRREYGAFNDKTKASMVETQRRETVGKDRARNAWTRPYEAS